MVEKVRAGAGFFGFDAHLREFAELDERGIIDPVKVVRLALESAVEVAGTLLLADMTLVDREDNPPSAGAMPMGME